MTRKKIIPRRKGRRPNWFRYWCDKTIQEKEHIDLIRDVLAGKEVDDYITSDGEKIPIKPKSRERADLLLRLAEWAYGKPVQMTQMLDAEGNAVAPAVVLMPQVKGEAGKVK